MFTDVPIVRATASDAFGSARRRSSMRYVIAVPATNPTETPVTERPRSRPGNAFHAASSPAATIIVATAANITARRPMRAAMYGTATSAAIVPAE
jgi:hypothetical protein